VGELKKLLGWLGPQSARFIAACAALMVSMCFGLMCPWLVGQLVDAALPSIKPHPERPFFESVNMVALVLFGTLLVQAVLTFFYSWTFNRVGERAVVELRTRLYRHVVGLPMRFFSERRVGDLTSTLANDMALIQELFCHIVPQALRQTMLLIGGTVAIFITSTRLSLVMFVSFPVLMLAAVFIGRKVRKVSREAQNHLADSTTIIEETLQGIGSVKAFGNEDFESRRYRGGLEKYLATVLRTARLRAGLVAFIIVGIFGSIILVLWYGATLMQRGELRHGELTMFTLYTLFVGGAVSSFAEVFSLTQKALGAHERVSEILRETGEDSGEAGKSAVRLRGDVEFDHVAFRYPSRPDVPVLVEVTLAAKRGERVALVGPSGAGKSTIVALLLRLYDPEVGSIKLDGTDARQFALDAVRGNMALVPQEVLLFGGTIRENIRYGKPSATEEEIRTAARRAHCEEFIERFPEGYETRVGERGVQLSGGQRQRIAIARAFLRDPAILILDEATSSLDAESEHLIQQALEELLAGRTAMIVAHRLATVRRCDRIYVVEAGQVIESGTHDSLMSQEGGRYRRLAAMQFTT
jgi:ABC-type multidrug transport system fused ATPase/permease subunit